jgi:hypothetical protein
VPPSTRKTKDPLFERVTVVHKDRQAGAPSSKRHLSSLEPGGTATRTEGWGETSRLPNCSLKLTGGGPKCQAGERLSVTTGRVDGVRVQVPVLVRVRVFTPNVLTTVGFQFGFVCRV